MIPPLAVPFSVRRLAREILAKDPPRDASWASVLAGATGASAVTFFPSGRAALSEAVRHAATPGRDEILIPAYTCWTVPASVVRAGLRVRIVDVDPVALDVDPGALAAAPTDRLAAAVAAHLFA